MNQQKNNTVLYKGISYRSSLDAHWAVFFEALDTRVEYEKESFLLEDGSRYTPAFYVPDWNCFIGTSPNRSESNSCMMLSKTGRDVLLLRGLPWQGGTITQYVDGHSNLTVVEELDYNGIKYQDELEQERAYFSRCTCGKLCIVTEFDEDEDSWQRHDLTEGHTQACLDSEDKPRRNALRSAVLTSQNAPFAQKNASPSGPAPVRRQWDARKGTFSGERTAVRDRRPSDPKKSAAPSDSPRRRKPDAAQKSVSAPKSSKPSGQKPAQRSSSPVPHSSRTASTPTKKR